MIASHENTQGEGQTWQGRTLESPGSVPFAYGGLAMPVGTSRIGLTTPLTSGGGRDPRRVLGEVLE